MTALYYDPRPSRERAGARRRVELVHVDDLAAGVSCGPAAHVVGRRAAGFHRGTGLPCRGGAAQAGGLVHQEARAAESSCLLQRGKDTDPEGLGHGLEVTLQPADSAALAVMAAVHDRDLPLVGLHGAAEDVPPAIADRAKLRVAGAHGRFVLPRTCCDALPGLTIDQHREAAPA